MLKNRFFGAPFNLLKSPLRAGVIIGGGTVTFTPTGIKYTGDKYYAWGEGTGSYANSAVLASSTDLTTWDIITYSAKIFSDVASNGTDVIVVGMDGVTPTIFRFNTALAVQAQYTPAGLSTPRYIEWCSAFSRFVISGASNRGYSTDSGGTAWVSQSYIGTAYIPAGLMFVSATGLYYDLRISFAAATWIVYSGATASAQTQLISVSGSALDIHQAKFAYKPGSPGILQVLSREVTGPTTYFGLRAFNISTGVSAGGSSTISSEAGFAGAAYFPLQDRYIALSATGQLSASRLVVPSTLIYNGTYNAGNLLSAPSLTSVELIISAPAGLVALGGNRQIYTNP